MVSFGNIINETINDKVIALHKVLTKDHFQGFSETVPTYSSLAVFYEPDVVKKAHSLKTPAYDFVKSHIEKLINGLPAIISSKNENLITVPVLYNGADLEETAKLHRMSVKELIHIHTEKTYRVFMIGFQPGFAYMGKLDERIATPRRSSPRTKVPAGSVGIAGFQTGIYPFSSPGGWQLIGQTPLRIFNKEKDEPCFFKAGDNVKFLSITKAEFEKQDEY